MSAEGASALPLTRVLSDLEAEWRSQGASISSGLRPGLSPDSIRAALEPLGIRPHAELLQWYGWHDGATDAYPESACQDSGLLIPMLSFLRLEQAIERTRFARWLATETPYGMPWGDGWFVISTNDDDVITVDCHGDTNGTHPVRDVWYELVEDWETPIADSLTEFAELVLDSLTRRRRFWDPTSERWGSSLDSEVPRSPRADRGAALYLF